MRACKYIWLGTHQKFDDAFTFIFEETEHGWIWAHAYQFDADTATFIVECSEATWRAAGFDRMSTEETQAACEKIFAKNLGGNKLMSNARHLRGSAWLNFNRVLCERWSDRNVVLLGDAAATAHFSVGSGSKLAMESAIALAEYLHTEPTMEAAFSRYEDERRLEVLKLQNAARNSTEWFENVERYLHLDPVQFNYSLLTRSQRISHENLRQRDAEWLAGAERWFEQRATGRRAADGARADVRAVEGARRRTQESRRGVADGAVSRRRRHADRLASRALRRARQGRRRARVHRDDLRFAGRAHHARLHRPLRAGTRGGVAAHCRFRSRRNRRQDRDPARPFRAEGLDPARLGKAGRAAGVRATGRSSRPRPSVVAGKPDAARDDARRHGQGARRLRARDRDGRARGFRLARTALRARLSDVGLHHAADQSPHRRIRRQPGKPHALSARSFPRGARTTWPDDKPISVRISANDWVGAQGITPQDAVEISQVFAEAGVDLIDVSAGQTSTQARPVYGRMFQTPFSDQIRNEAGIATLAVGNIYEPDHVNSILMAGRADLVCLARPHLADPYWTLHAAADLRYEGETWPKPYLSGRDQLYRLKSRPDIDDGKSVMGALAGQHALITGGGSGIGAAIAAALADAGAAVSIAGRRSAPLETVAARLPKAKAIVADVTREDECGAMVAERAQGIRPDRHRHSQRGCRREQAVRQDRFSQTGSA